MLDVRKLVVVLAAASVAGLVPTAAHGSPLNVQTASYPWPQPPVWTGTLPASLVAAGMAAIPTTQYAPTQPPARIPIGPAAPFKASTPYQWVQPAASGTATTQVTNTASASTQPPAGMP